jgi:hypothetical protein
MGSSSSSLASGSGRYTFRLFFYDEVDNNESAGKDHSMTNDEMHEKFGKLTDTSEEIQEVSYYTNPLNNWQLYNGKVKPTGLEFLWGNWHHAYIVFKTDKWWWSVEKNDTCVAIQRTNRIQFVRDMYCRADRRTALLWAKIDCAKSKTGQIRTVKELLEHLQARNYVNQEYHVTSENCQHFADNIYDFL